MAEQQQRVVAGRYTVIRELGRGGMGVVWLAEDKLIGRRVAVKELLLPAGIPPAERHVFEERVLREARTAGRLSDPGIVTVHDIVQENGATFIVMELIEAPNLAEMVQRHGPVPPDRVLRIAEQVLLALQTAHAAGVVHRDVKPSNVMVAANGRVKLTDFGIAQTTEDPRLTVSGMLIGSPTYISPERLLGQPASPASDLWALGATLFFAAEGYGPYDRSSTAASIQAIMNERPGLRVVPPGPLADLITGLMNPAAETRLTMTQAHELIDRARGQLPSTGPQPVRHHPHPPVPTPHSGPQPVVQHPRSGPQPLVQPPSPPVHGTQVLPPRRTGRTAALVAVAVVVLAGVTVAVLAATGVFDSPRSGTTASSGSDSPSGSSSEGSEDSGDSGSGDARGGPAPQQDPDGPRTYGPGGDVTAEEFVDSATTGCYTGNNTAALQEVDCSESHTIEIYDQLDLGGDSYPEPGALAQAAQDGCAEKSRELTPEEQITVGVLVPTTDAWAAGKRRALCFAAKTDGGQLTGSVAGN